ncbi:trp operon repressor [Vibrio sp. S4M6]|uniref:trp operon repressor n=1 Tax=Vibrio sinus TaxID=2946865 RepID=UPI00202A7E6F|nr:trp operon repressor [Vibrio sinus]MCL9781362.1 trp operon repressor [Vibrio sinus]
MPFSPEYNDWDQFIQLINRAIETGQHELLLGTMLTPDERDALVTRANILSELLKGELSQRQMSQELGVGIATITRGSNELKAKSEQEKCQIAELLLKPQ